MYYPPGIKTSLDRARYFIERMLLDGLVHGHFDFSIHSEITNGGTRRLTISAGKSHQFLIPADDLKIPLERTNDDSRHGSV